MVSEQHEVRLTVSCKIDSWSCPSQGPQNSSVRFNEALPPVVSYRAIAEQRKFVKSESCELQPPKSDDIDRNSNSPVLFLSLPFAVLRVLLPLLATTRIFPLRSLFPLLTEKPIYPCTSAPVSLINRTTSYPDEYKSNCCTDVLS